MRRQLLDKRMKRRDFLKASSAAVATPAIVAMSDRGEPVAATMPAAGNDQSPGSATKAVNGAAVDLGDLAGVQTGRFTGAVAVGYYDGKPNGYFIDARSLPASEISPSGGSLGIQVVDGELWGQPDLGAIRSLSLSFDLRSGHGYPLRVWYRQLAPIPQSSAAMSFWLPRDEAIGGNCWLNVRFNDQSGALERIPVVFGPDAEHGIESLRSGYYAIAVTSGKGIDWNSVQLRGGCDGNTLCLNATGSPLSEAPWVLFTVTRTRA